MSEIVEVVRTETVLLETPGPTLEIIEVAEQGPPGRDAEDAFDTALDLIYQIAKL